MYIGNKNLQPAGVDYASAPVGVGKKKSAPAGAEDLTMVKSPLLHVLFPPSRKKSFAFTEQCTTIYVQSTPSP